jgi:class 3 adenylate cyclase/DNA-binding CsgD family transcriptional regulator
MEREVRYCTSEDGVRIAYCVEGEGPPLVYLPFLVESFSLDHLLPEGQQFLRRLGQGRPLVRFDARGTGLSQRDVADMSHAAFVRDLEAVVRAAGLKRFSILAGSTFGPVAIAYAARHPRHVGRLILLRSYARLLDAFSRETLGGFTQLARANWALTARTFADMAADAAARPEFVEPILAWAEIWRQSTTGDEMARRIEQDIELDVTALLPRVKALTLVISYPDDAVFPVALGQQLAAAIPNARFLPLQGRVSIIGFEDPDRALEAVDAFLREEEPAPKPQPADSIVGRIVRTVLFTDIVGHTEMMQRLGDERGRDVLREHERITREVLKVHGGTEVKTMGDGFMASFGSVTRAVECAVTLQKAFEEWNAGVGAQHAAPLRVRVGLSAGEPIEEEGDLFGATVILASRIAERAEGGEILVANAVRELCAGKDFVFADRGTRALKGFDEPVRLYRVEWSESYVEGPPVSKEPATTLTARETEVLSLLAGGCSGKEIAARLTVSLSTVQRHISNIYAKIGARGRVEAAAYAIKHGLVQPRDS